MKRVLLDTSVYGRIIEKNEIELFKELIENKIIVYGNQLIRKELRETPKQIKISDREKLINLRIYLLTLYDEIVKNHLLEITDKMFNLADSYYEAYREFGGNRAKERILNDLIIVACASIKKIDIVVSEDEKSMLGRDAIRAYKLVNKIKGERTPNFINYNRLKESLRSSNFNKLPNSFFEFWIFNILFIIFPYFLMSLFFCFHNKKNFINYINFSLKS